MLDITKIQTEMILWSTKKIHAIVTEQYIRKMKRLFHGKIFSSSGGIVLSPLFFGCVVQGYNSEHTESCHVLFEIN